MAVTFDANATAPTTANAVTSINATNLTVGAGSQRALTVQICWSGAVTSPSMAWDNLGTPQTVSAITGATATNTAVAQVWGLVAPTSGAKQLHAQWTTARDVVINGVSWTGVDQTGGATSFPHGTGATGTSNTATSVTVTSATNNAVIALNATATAGETSVNNTQTFLTNTPANMSAAGNRAAGAATVAMTSVLFGTSGAWAAAGSDIAVASAGGSSFTQTCTETITWSDTLARLTSKSLADTLTPSDVLVRMTGKLMADTWTPSDVLTRQAGKALPDMITLTDAVSRAMGKPLADSITLTDTLTRLTSKPLTETVTFSDVLTSVKVFLRTLTESITWSDTLSRRTGKLAADTVTLTDVLTTASHFFRTLTETLTFSDVLTAIKQSILAAAKACETFFLGPDRGVGVVADPTMFAIGGQGVLESVSADPLLARPNADRGLAVGADVTLFTDVGC